MEKDRLEELLELRNALENVYADVIREINREQLANAVITLANNEGVMHYLNEQNLADNIMEEEVN